MRATRTATFSPDPRAVADGRRFIRRALADWGATAVEPEALLLGSELLSNAFLHAGTEATLSVELDDDSVRICVADRYAGRSLPVAPVEPPPDSEGRRGLLLVSRLAQQWGVDYAGSAKRVWFRLALDPSAAALPARIDPRPAEAELSESPRVAAVTLDDAGVVTAWPAEAVALTGRPVEATVGTPYADVVAWPEGSPAGATLDEALTLGHWDAGYGIRRDGDEPVAVFASHLRLSGDSGKERVVVLLTAAADRMLLERREPVRPQPAPARGSGGASATLGVDALLTEVLGVAMDALSGDAAYAVIVGEEDDTFEVRAELGVDARDKLLQLAPAEGTTGRVSTLHLPTVVDDVTTDPAPPIPAGHDFRSLVAAPLLVSGRLTGALHVAAREPGRFGNADAVVLQQLADDVALAVERGRLVELERRRRGRVAFLAEASELLAGTLDPTMTVAMLAQLVVPSLADWCGVHLLDAAGTPRLAYAWHADESRLDALRGALGAERPVASGRWRDEYVALHPLGARGRELGTLTVGRSDRPLTRDDLRLVDDLARRAGLAIDNGQLFAERAAIAETLQHSLLPPEIPDVSGCDFAVAYEAAGTSNEVGGDFYDVFRLDRGRAGIAVGDVCGKGAEAAAVTGLARNALRLLAGTGMPMQLVLERLNAAILDEGPRARFVTLVYAELTPQRGGIDVRLVRAGHPAPYVVHPDGTCEPVGTDQPLLGVFDDLPLTVDELHLAPGDVLVAYTDGVTERRSGRDMFGEHGIRAVLADCGGRTAQAVVTALERAVSDFATEPPSDDRALLAVRAL